MLEEKLSFDIQRTMLLKLCVISNKICWCYKTELKGYEALLINLHSMNEHVIEKPYIEHNALDMQSIYLPSLLISLNQYIPLIYDENIV